MIRNPRSHALIALASAALPLTAQWLNYKEPGVPRTKDGKVTGVLQPSR